MRLLRNRQFTIYSYRNSVGVFLPYFFAFAASLFKAIFVLVLPTHFYDYFAKFLRINAIFTILYLHIRSKCKQKIRNSCTSGLYDTHGVAKTCTFCFWNWNISSTVSDSSKSTPIQKCADCVLYSVHCGVTKMQTMTVSLSTSRSSMRYRVQH